MLFRFRISCLLLLGALSATAQPYTLESPNGFLKLVVETQPTLQWRLDLRGEPLLLPAPIGLKVDLMGELGPKIAVAKAKFYHIDTIEHPEVHQKSALIRNHYNELVLRCDHDWGVIFRAYDEGVAYRLFLNFRPDTLVLIEDETFTCRPAHAETIWWPAEEGFYSSNERVAQAVRPTQLTPQSLASLPALIGSRNGAKVLITESDLWGYPGLWLRGDGASGLRGDFPHYPKYTVRTTNRDVRVTDRQPFLTRADGYNRLLPWRVFLVAEQDEQLLTNQMPWLLAEPSQIADSEWIKPGKAAWDWWSNLNLYGPGVTFKAGVNTATYRHFIDFAAQNGLEYVVLDEGWSDTGDLLRVNPDLDLPALAAYANSKNVGLILWCTWLSLNLQLDAALDQFERWGIRGIKVDFMQRDDAEMVQYYWRVAEAAAQRHLIVDFHGAHKPAGLQRTWPNVLTFEGVYGLEQCKWDKTQRIDPEHDVTLPFTRNVAGPMDYTPGAMLNRQRADWAPSWQTPASLGTRCHELAKYVVFESPLQMLADSPTHYQKEPECLQWLRAVPTVWQQTVALPSRVGDYVAVARQAANGLWYVGAMTDWTARELVLDTRFLPAGEYEVEIFADGPNAARNAQDYTRTVGQHLRSGAPLKVKMAPGGGFVAVLRAVMGDKK